MTDNIRSDEQPAQGRTAPKRRISPIWFIPIVALAIAGYLGYVTLSEKGPTITISFVTAEGLESGKTKVRFKDVEIGTVTDVSVSEDLKHVIATAEMDKDVAAFLTENTTFWIVKPRVGIGGVSGLGTLLSGAYIAMQVDEEGESSRSFEGLEIPPAISSDVPGTSYVIHSDALGQISRGTPVYFNNLEVGLVIDYKFNIESRDFTMPIFIHAPYDKLVLKQSQFWNIGGLNIQTSATGIAINTPPLEALLRGGITFNSPQSGGEIAAAGETFELYPNQESTRDARITRNLPLMVEFGGTVKGLKDGAPVEWQGIRVGSVTDVSMLGDPTRKQNVQVILDLQPERTQSGTEDLSDEEIYERISKMIENGLRAQLKTSNFLTGELYVDFNFQTGVPKEGLDMSTTPPMAPSVPTELDSLRTSVTDMIAKLQAIPIDDIANRLDRTLAAVEGITTSPELQDSLKNFSQASADLSTLLADLNADAKPILENFRTSSTELSGAVAAAETAMQSANSLLASNSPMRIQLERATDELARAARSVRIFADTLERDPSALIRGKR